ncbi:dNA polymerase III delta' subunit [Clostridium sp. CAG:451]|jgi:DNA polymerase III gamma/tau subunit|nr:dNA polymerase III delta' subunit [Clostridium sp. CAG:451]
MLEQLRENQRLFYEQAIVPLNSGRINHAYLIETNNNEDELVDTYLNEFYKQLLICGLNESNEVGISKEKLINLLENKSYPDLLEIKPENNVIKKEQLLEMMEKFSNKSVYGTYQIYVIHHAEMLNLSSANTILKFLEEPENNIIAVLLSTHRYKVLPTILSRCTVMTLKQEKSNMIDVNDNQILIKLLNNLLIDTEPLIILFNDYYESLFQTKELSLDTLKKISKILQYYIQTNDLSSLSIKSSDINLNKFQLLEIVSIIDEFSVKLQYNVNIKLWLDSLLIKLTEVKNEIFNY